MQKWVQLNLLAEEPRQPTRPPTKVRLQSRFLRRVIFCGAPPQSYNHSIQRHLNLTWTPDKFVPSDHERPGQLDRAGNPFPVWVCGRAPTMIHTILPPLGLSVHLHILCIVIFVILIHLRPPTNVPLRG
jgi:hypothetical protein